MPKKLIADIYGGYKAMNDYEVDTGSVPNEPQETQQAEVEADTGDAAEDLV